MYIKFFLRFLVVTFLFTSSAFAQIKPVQNNKQVIGDCIAKLENGLLTIENSQISRSYLWNNGNLITRSLTDKLSGKIWQMNSNKPDLVLPGEAEKAENAVFASNVIAESTINPEHLEIEVIYTLNKLEIKRVFRLYHNCPVIACDLYFRGESFNTWFQSGTNTADMVNLEKLTSSNAGNNTPVIEKIELPGRHWEINAIEFFDVTDRFNTLVNSVNALSYKQNSYRGNLFFAHENITNNGIFILKEAPSSNVQLSYPGGDFITEFGTFRAIGVGLNTSDLDLKEWKQGYSFATGVYSGDEKNRLTALRNYQKNLRLLKPGRDEMILMNTWGDRGQDTRISERFALAELEAGARLGITHFQLDDGWQTGISSNSTRIDRSQNAFRENDHCWEPNPAKFPNGLNAVVKKGKDLGIEVCLWFSPSLDKNYGNWGKDADVLINFYKKYGIHTFKIDMVTLANKLAEINFRKFLDKVVQGTDKQVVFNLDVTAGRRGGYHYFNEYGNLFLENRYTDWVNYYPYTTLRNLWMLSKYVPAQKLQIEFLNKWRNTKNYIDDPYGPSNYSFDYLFAITMMAQPLAWFEGTGLPEEAFTVGAPVIKKYREIQSDLHSGNIFPIGDEPSGKSWTGFHSVQEGKGYFLVFRESNTHLKYKMKTWLKAGLNIKCTSVIGKGKSFSAKSGEDGEITFELPEINSYTLYKYVIISGK